MAGQCRFRIVWAWCVGFAWPVVAALGGAAARPVVTAVPPPEPDVRPQICRDYSEDADQNRIADSLEVRALAAASTAPTALAELTPVELVFSTQITQSQLNAFQVLGGQIDYVYRSVSYGWNGRLPLGQVTLLPAVMGTNLVQVAEPKAAQLHLDMATQCGRVRPVWAAGFAGTATGFSGDPSITIAIVDTGVDATHTDLAGRQKFWADYSDDWVPTSHDLIQHGSHVAGIALGTGAAGGSTTGTLFLTQADSMVGVPTGSTFFSSLSLPAVQLSVNSVARFGGSSAASMGMTRITAGGTSFSWLTPPGTTTSTSPLAWSATFTPSTSSIYAPALLSNGQISDFVITSTITNYPGVGDGFNRFRGVAPNCMWANAKVFSDSGSSSSTAIGAAIDDLVTRRVTDNIKVMNLSLGLTGNPGLDTSIRTKVNNAVNNGIVVCVSAGNDGTLNTSSQRQIDDPGRAALALTVAASNDINRLTEYSSVGFSSPSSVSGAEEDYKPDLMAPGGSFRYSGIISIDSNSGDTGSYVDQQPNDYYSIEGTSMSSPFAAGCAALVIDALQHRGITWSFASGEHAKFVKMVLCATATESNANRESNLRNPTLQRAGVSSGFPAGKDANEGYGLINADAAVEAVYLTYFESAIVDDTLGSAFNQRRAWARAVQLTAGRQFAPTLTLPAGCDYDLYLYNATPSATGTPVILASSTSATTGATEHIAYTAPTDTTAILVVKRVSGAGAFVLSTAALPADYNRDGHVDEQDLPHFTACALGPGVAQLDTDCADADFDQDGDVDAADFGIWQRCLTGATGAIDPHCAD